MPKNHHAPYAHLLHPPRPRLDERICPVLQISDQLALARGEMGGIVRQVELVWEERGEGFGRGWARVKTCSRASGGVPGSQQLALATDFRS